MKIYVAAKFEEKARVREMYRRLREAGHVITHDWTNEDEAGRTGPELREYLMDCAADDIEGVRTSDVVLVYPHRLGRGLYVELGCALAWCKTIVVVGEVERDACIFLHHANAFCLDDGDALRLLSEWEATS